MLWAYCDKFFAREKEQLTSTVVVSFAHIFLLVTIGKNAGYW